MTVPIIGETKLLGYGLIPSASNTLAGRWVPCVLLFGGRSGRLPCKQPGQGPQKSATILMCPAFAARHLGNGGALL